VSPAVRPVPPNPPWAWIWALVPPIVIVPEEAIRRAPPPPPPPAPVFVPVAPPPPPPDPPTSGRSDGVPYAGPPLPAPVPAGFCPASRCPAPPPPALAPVEPVPPPGPSPVPPVVVTSAGAPLPPSKPPGPPWPPLLPTAVAPIRPFVPVAPEMSTVPLIVTLPVASHVTGVLVALCTNLTVTLKGMLIVVKLKTPLGGTVNVVMPLVVGLNAPSAPVLPLLKAWPHAVVAHKSVTARPITADSRIRCITRLPLSVRSLHREHIPAGAHRGRRAGRRVDPHHA